MNSAIFGYMIGSPTSDSAQCRSAIASSTRSGSTPSHPANCLRSLYSSGDEQSSTRWLATIPS